MLLTGATGTGEDVHAAAIVHHINQNHPVHIVTIEDPIEFLHQNIGVWVSQREVGSDTASFSIALRAAMRQDPDVVLVGEIRDHETADIALKAAETGHLVLSTVHTPDAAKTIDRLLAMFPPEEQTLVRQRLADNLRATVSQRLMPRADGNGRVVALEIMSVTGTLREWLLEMTTASTVMDIIEKSRDQYGMQTFDQCLRDLAARRPDHARGRQGGRDEHRGLRPGAALRLRRIWAGGFRLRRSGGRPAGAASRRFVPSPSSAVSWSPARWPWPCAGAGSMGGAVVAPLPAECAEAPDLPPLERGEVVVHRSTASRCACG